MNRDERIVVVGAGLAGLRAAERLRELKFDGEIIILGDERLPPYHRPALSKQLLMGTLRPSDLTLPAYEDIGAKWRFGTQVRYLLPRNRTLQLPGGEELTYDGLVLATGVEARRPNNIPYHDPRVLVLRTMPDAMDLERVINSTKGRVAVVGGGFTGCEIAASLRHMSREVTLIGRADNLLGNVLGPELGTWLTNLHRDHGVDLALGNSVQDWAPAPEGIGLRLTDGSTMLASCVVVAAGTVPTTAWLRGSGLPLDNGVVCDATCHVVGADDIVAAGDVAQWPNLRFDNEPRRVEHWLNAIEMGRAAAESLMAGRAAAQPFAPMPRFWTEQYGVRIQAAGMPKLGPEVISLGKPDDGTGTVYGYSRDGRLMGVVGLDCPSSVLAWTESVSRQNPVPRQRAITAGGGAPKQITAGAQTAAPPSKRRAGRHQLPPATKQPATARPKIRQHDIGYVDTPVATPMETSGPLRQIDGEVAGPSPMETGAVPWAGGERVGAGPRRGSDAPGSLTGLRPVGGDFAGPRVGGGVPAGSSRAGGDAFVGPRGAGPSRSSESPRPVGGEYADARRAGPSSGSFPAVGGEFAGQRVDGAGPVVGSDPSRSSGAEFGGQRGEMAGSGAFRRVGEATRPVVNSGGGGASGPLPVRPSPPGWGHPVQVSGPVPPVPAVPPGRPKNAVDSFSRMMPVSVRPPARSTTYRPPSVPQSGYLGPNVQSGRHGQGGGFGRSEPTAPADRQPSRPAFGGYQVGGRQEEEAARPALSEREGPRPPVFGGEEPRPAAFVARERVRPPEFRVARHREEDRAVPSASRLGPDDVRPVELTAQLPVIGRPRHARPDDDEHEAPRQWSGPEDSYDRMPAVRGGRRRRRD